MNTFGTIFRLTTFGESHGEAIGGIVDGMPAGVEIDIDFIQAELDRRRPGQSSITTSRNETDKVKLLSGVFEGKSTGTPIGFIVENQNHYSADYDDLRDVFRPSHADYTYWQKYGIRDHRGGGRSSARITISRVVAGALAKLVLQQYGIEIEAWPSQIGPFAIAHQQSDQTLPQEVINFIEQVKAEGDSVGGVISGIIKGCPAGLGNPEFGKLHAQLASAMMSINAAKGFEYGDGFTMAEKRGSEVQDLFVSSEQHIALSSNHSGGIQGGISNGATINFRVAFKPVATLLREQPTIDIHGNPMIIKPRGRHDPCVVPRAVPIVEAMAAMVILDALLLNR